MIPHNSYAVRAARNSRKAVGIATQASYEEAAALCKAKVDKIVKECRRVNQKYRDPHFDLEWDLKWGNRDTLESLHNVKNPPESEFKPKSVKRVPDIFDNPKFYIDGPTANDVRQGKDGDCWLLAALCTLSNKSSLIERCCVARDEQVGVYGFVFFRDDEWISEIIDDKLFLTKPDFEESFLERILWEDRERVESEEQYRKAYQSGSGALYFAQCVDADETWLPLLEKAYAKAHGDYAAIEGGFTGEGIEDLTGGVTSELYTSDILDKEYFWKEELMKVNQDFLFGCSTGMWGVGWGERSGIVELHAYSIMSAVEMDGHRLLLLKNPWGKGEWKGAWSDGSKEWTAEWITKLNHRFGDDGAFWISFEDLLRKYQAFDRTRLFGPEWKVTSLWTTVSVPWTLDYHETQFAFSLSRTGPVVIVLSQLDDRYYRGLEGQYRFELNFRLHKAGQEDYVVRSISPYCQKRSVNVELELEAGDYAVLLKVNATRDLDILPIEQVVRNNARERRDKLVAVGMSYDLAHSKGRVVETEEEVSARKEAEKRKNEEEKQSLKRAMMDARRKAYYFAVKELDRRREKRARHRAKYRLKKSEIDEREKTEEPAGSPERRGSVENVSDNHGAPPVKLQQPSPAPEPDDPSKESETRSGRSSTDESMKTPLTEPEKPPGEICPETNTGVQQTSNADTTALPAAMGSTRGTRTHFAAIPPAGGPSRNRGGGLLRERVWDNAPPDTTAVDSETEESDEESDIPSVSDVSDRELEYHLMEIRASASRQPPPAQPPRNSHAERQDEFESNPWNAVATVGLRVYYKISDEDKDQEIVKLRVVRPNPYATKTDEEGSENTASQSPRDGKGGPGGEDVGTGQSQVEEKAGEVERGLDIDDSSKDATLVGDQERRKKSIFSPAESSVESSPVEADDSVGLQATADADGEH